MRVLLATPSLANEFGGPTYAVKSVDQSLREAGIETRVITRPSQGGLAMAVFGHNRGFDGVDVVHNFGTWTPFNHQVSVRARHAGIPQVLSPMGMLEPWALSHKSLKKRLGWMLYQRRDIAGSAVIHATAHAEAHNLRNLGVRGPVAVVPHGIHIPDYQPSRALMHRGSGKKTALFLSRIHPVKGLLELVEACAFLRPDDWRVVVAGPDSDGYRSVVEKAVSARGMQDVFEFVGPVYGERKANLFGQAHLFVLPTHSENFGLVVPEALAHGVPVITTTRAPWEELAKAGCGWWVPPGVSSLIEVLSEAFTLPESALASMGARGRSLVQTRYTWSTVIRQHEQLYKWVLGGGERPDFIVD